MIAERGGKFIGDGEDLSASRKEKILQLDEASGAEALRGSELKQLVSDLAAERHISPEAVARFLRVDTSDSGKITEHMKKAFLVVGSTYLTISLLRKFVPDIAAYMDSVDIPSAIHKMLNGLRESLPGLKVLEDPAFGKQMERLLYESTIALGLKDAVKGFLNIVSTKPVIRQKQTEAKSLIEEGKFKFEMDEGHTAAFVNGGDALADVLRKTSPVDKMMVYGTEPMGLEVWQRIERMGDQDDVFDALDRGDFRTAGEIMVFSNSAEDMFLPDAELNNGMGLDEISTTISVARSYEENRGIEHRPIFIIADSEMQETYMTSDRSGAIKERTETLQERVDAINETSADNKSQSHVEVIDPTKVVMAEIVRLAAGRSIKFHSGSEGMKRYSDRFWDELDRSDYTEPEKGSDEAKLDAVIVHYDIDDISKTHAHKGIDPKNEIVVIIDPRMRQAVEKSGVPSEQIIVVSDALSEHMQQIVMEQ